MPIETKSQNDTYIYKMCLWNTDTLNNNTANR